MVNHTDFKHYNFGVGLDVKVLDQNKHALVDVEVKNWKHFDRPYGSCVAKSEILDRFAQSTARIKLLIISYRSLLTQDALTLIRSHDIQIVELGNLVTKSTFSQLFASTLKQLKHVLFGAKVYHHTTKTIPLTNYTEHTVTVREHDTNILTLEELMSRAVERASEIVDDWYWTDFFTAFYRVHR
jgi:hypothetical protein